MENIRTATITWIKHYNFGTYLQAYALQQVIYRLGYKNSIIDDSSIIEELHSPVSIYTKLKRILWLLTCGKSFKMYQCKSNKMYDAFKKRYLRIDTNTQPLQSLNDRYDQFICGSDQIWYPSESIFSPYYYLAFTNKKKIAYAPSIGVSSYPKEFIPKVMPLLQCIPFLSVRERQGAEILEGMLNRRVETVLDPTLLLTSDSWEQLLLPITDTDKNEAPYILCYFLSNNFWYMDFVLEFGRQKGLLVKIFATHPSYLSYGDKAIACGPLEFLQAVKRSTYFFTDSFHGTIFSIHFEKRFYTFRRFDDSSNNNQNSRLENLFSMLGIPSYFIGQDNLDKIGTLPDVDYIKLKQMLSLKREKSLAYLSNALKSQYTHD